MTRKEWYMTATIPCNADDGFKCPYIDICLARITDRTVTGCGIALYMIGLIEFNEIGVKHTVKEGGAE